MSKPLIHVFLIACAACLAANASGSEALANKYACTACHAPDRRVVGPSWKEIADKYKGGAISPTALGANIKAGSSGKWGAIPMPPQSTVPDADLVALATWILATK